MKYTIGTNSPELDQLAERLGVNPTNSECNIVLIGKSGSGYDPFALLNAMLDRLDEPTSGS